MHVALFETDGLTVEQRIKKSMMVETRTLKKIIGKDAGGKAIYEEWTGPCAVFATNEGRGTGATVIPVHEFNDAIASLEAAIDSNFESAQMPYEYESAATVIERTIGLAFSDQDLDDDGKPNEGAEPSVVTFSTRRGKGSKPASIPLADIGVIVSLLRNTAKPVAKAAKQLAIEETAVAEAEVPVVKVSVEGEGNNEK